MSTLLNLRRQKIFFIAIFLAFAATGMAAGLKIESDSGHGQAAGPSLRTMTLRVEQFDATSTVLTSDEAKLWIDVNSGDSRAEVRDASGQLQLVEVRRGLTFERLKVAGASEVYTSSTALPSSPRVWQGYVDQVLGPAERLSLGAVRSARSEQLAGRAASVIRGSVDDGGAPLTIEELVDKATGLTLERRWLRTLPDGREVLDSGVRFVYISDRQASPGSGTFEVTAPPDALRYSDAELRSSDLRDRIEFRVFGLANSAGLRLVGISETQSSGPGIMSQHLVNLLYAAPNGTSVTITNQSASGLAGVPRCEAPKSIAAGSQADVIAEGNLSCDLGSFVDTSVGRGVLRSGSPALEIQLGGTVVFVHASTPAEALDLASSLGVVD